MESLRLLVLSSCLCLSLSLWGKEVASATVTTNSFNQLKKQLIDQERSVGKLTGDMMKLEKEIGKGNERYLKILQKRRDFENNLFDIKQTLKKYDQELESKKEKTNKLLATAVMSGLDKKEDAALLLGRKIAIERLKSELAEIKYLWGRNKELTTQMEEFKVRYEEYLTVETELASVLNNLEAQKKEIQDSYEEELLRKNTLKQKVDHLSTTIRPKEVKVARPAAVKEAKTESVQVQAPVDVQGVFSSPLKNVERLEPQKRGGINFLFKGSQAVLAARDGRVMYCGDLSTYGNVVMIDHGSETTSVILGTFSPKVAKGAMVKLGDTIGQTLARGPNGKIYFEIRRKNNVQNTYKLLDPKSVSSKNKI